MKKYINFDTEERKNAANDFETDDQFCLWQNLRNGEFTKNNKCTISKQWKRYFKVH